MRAFLIITFCLNFVLFCGGKSSKSSAASTVLLAKESGSDGCTVVGIGNQIKAGYTPVTTTPSFVRGVVFQDTYYSVIQIKGALPATNIVFNQDIKPNIYLSTSCPLNLDSDVLAKEGTDYTRTVIGITTTIGFLKAGSYLLYYLNRANIEASGLTVITTGTAVSSTSDDSLTALLNGTSATTFKFACNTSSTGICQNFFGLFIDCLSGGTKQTAKCTETGAVGSCKLSQASIGTIISVYTSPLTTATAPSSCSSPGTYLAGSTIQTP